MKNRLNRKGFTYLAVLMLLMIMEIMLGAVGQSWRTVMQREREEELLFRGQQIKDAIKDWQTPRPGSHPPTPLNELKDLVLDPRTPTTKHRLRRLYTDPMTGKEWTIIKDPTKGIVGVASTSQGKPLKIGGFPDELKDFTGKNSYSEWQFMYMPAGQNPVNTGQLPVHPAMPGGMLRP